MGVIKVKQIRMILRLFDTLRFNPKSGGTAYCI